MGLVFFNGDWELCPLLKLVLGKLISLECVTTSCIILTADVPGRPCSCALIDHGIGGLPYFASIILSQIVYLSSESIINPSISSRQARTGGKLALLLAWFITWRGFVLLGLW